MDANARLAQWESACLTRRWSQVQILHRALSGPERGGAGAGGRRHESVRGGAPPFRTARRFAPGIETPLRAGGALRRVPMHQGLLFVKGGRASLSHFPPGHAGVEPSVRHHLFSRARRYTGGPNAHRRPREEARERLGTPVSDRHRGPEGRERRPADGEGVRPGTGTPTSGRHARCRWRRSAAGHGNAGLQTGTAARRAANGALLNILQGAQHRKTGLSKPHPHSPECVGNERNPPGTLTVGLPF